jgi:hypothetical protein
MTIRIPVKVLTAEHGLAIVTPEIQAQILAPLAARLEALERANTEQLVIIKDYHARITREQLIERQTALLAPAPVDAGPAVAAVEAVLAAVDHEWECVKAIDHLSSVAQQILRQSAMVEEDEIDDVVSAHASACETIREQIAALRAESSNHAADAETVRRERDRLAAELAQTNDAIRIVQGDQIDLRRQRDEARAELAALKGRKVQRPNMAHPVEFYTARVIEEKWIDAIHDAGVEVA